MKKLSVFISILLVLSMCLTANAAETDAPVMHPLGDVNLDGSVTADDARFILRAAVGLGSITREGIVYGDCDFSGDIGASDARFALRTAVGLEEKQDYAFYIEEVKGSTCSEEGFIKGKCAVTGKEVILTYEKEPHRPPYDIECKGKGNCINCGEELTAEIAHNWENNYLENIRKCGRCGLTESLEHVHKFNAEHVCNCGINAMYVFQYDITNYLKQYGEKGEGYYYVEGYMEPLVFALFYEDVLGFPYAYCGFAVETNGMVLYYDFNYDFTDGTVEAVLYAEDTEVAYAYGKIDPSKVNEAADGDAITITEYTTIPELNGMKKEFRQMMEGAVHDMVKWLRAYIEEIGVSYSEHIFADFVNVK